MLLPTYKYNYHRSSKKLSQEYNTENHHEQDTIQRSYIKAGQFQEIHLHHSSCIYGSGNTVEEGQTDYESQNTRTSALKQSFVEMAV